MELRSTTAPLEQVTTLQRVVILLEPKVGSLEGQSQDFKIRQAGVMEKLDRTAGLLDDCTITIQATTSRLICCEPTLQTVLNRITIFEKGANASATGASPGLGTPSSPPEPPNDPPPSHLCSGSYACFPWCASKVCLLEDANKFLDHEVARLNTQVVDPQGGVLNQSENKVSWKAQVMSESRESLEGVRRQHLQEIRYCHHCLILTESYSDPLKVEVVDSLARRVHEFDRHCASLK